MAVATQTIDRSMLFRNRSAYERMQEVYQQQLNKITVPYQLQYVPTRHGETHVLTAGPTNAPALVLFHGMNANLTTWYNEINAFSRSYRVIVPDTIGDTGLSAPNRPGRNGLAYSEWAVDVLDAVGVKRAHMVGISGGGWQILKLAVVAPERIISAVLMSSGGFTTTSKTLIFRLMPWVFYNPREAARRFLRIMTPPYIAIKEEEIDLFELLLQFKYPGELKAMPDEELRRMTAPTKLMMGEYEKAFNAKQVLERARRVLPNLQFADIIPGVGHGMVGERPALVHRHILEFIEAHEGQGKTG
jgi:pimeloyl-ACP methyl ester carboxylesterase